MIIEIILGVLGGSTAIGFFIHKFSKSLHSSNHSQKQNSIQQQLIGLGSSPLSDLHQRENYYTTRRIEKQQAHTAILQEIEGKKLDLYAYYNQVESKVLELKSTYLDIREVKREIVLERQLMNIDHQKNALELKTLSLQNKESLFELKKQNFEVVKNQELLTLQQKSFDLDKVSFANEQQKKFLELDTKQTQLHLDKYSLQLVGKTIEQQLIDKKLTLDYRQNEQKLTQQGIQNERTSNANYYASEKLSLDWRLLHIDRKKMELDKEKYTISIPPPSTPSKSYNWEEMKEIRRAEEFNKRWNELSNTSNQNSQSDE